MADLRIELMMTD